MSDDAIIQRYDRPWAFYSLATLGPWTAWGGAAWLSHQEGIGRAGLTAVAALLLLGLLLPFLTAWRLTRTDPVLRDDLHRRLVRPDRRQLRLATLGAGIMLGSILLAQALSLLLGYSTDQFRLAANASFSAGILPGWFPLLLAPIIEELSWHSYGTDCLRRSMSLFWTSIVFALYWTVWHAPLGMVAHYYQAQVAETGWIHALNFALSLIPFVLIMNWLYYRSNRSIPVVIVFHLSAGLFNEMFQTHPDTKVIQTGLLVALTAALIIADPGFFFGKPRPGGMPRIPQATLRPE
ncbi:CAAX prenyl protease-like protein [Azospirillum brasilense]|uniref:CAAX prenyl protease-like protein n=1 Tax=Azospirillum brasilense TaxID=192 RepID=A0A560CDD2_AZOBR|nr:CPBP family intramembrane glutamic endopeptidase [Azospirillum brasilense]TWA82859.1 CAAX prenyl protease-like protein [Azospirillum brasilense]